MSDLEKVVRKAEALAQRRGHAPSLRELISGVRDIKNAPIARFVQELMRPQAPQRDANPDGGLRRRGLSSPPCC